MLAGPPGERIAAIRREDLDACADFLFRCYRDSPEFAALYGVETAEELDGCRPIFAGISAIGAVIEGAAIGCYREDELVGAVVCLPLPGWLRRRLQWLWRPATIATQAVRHWLRYRPKLAPAARMRWQAYDRLVKRQTLRAPHLRVFALAVSPAVRRSGVAGALLRSIAMDGRWRRHATQIVVDTWCDTNVAIYARLGFKTIAQSEAKGVRVWTMVAPLATAGAESRVGAGAAPSGR